MSSTMTATAEPAPGAAAPSASAGVSPGRSRLTTRPRSARVASPAAAIPTATRRLSPDCRISVASTAATNGTDSAAKMAAVTSASRGNATGSPGWSWTRVGGDVGNSGIGGWTGNVAAPTIRSYPTGRTPWHWANGHPEVTYRGHPGAGALRAARGMTAEPTSTTPDPPSTVVHPADGSFGRLPSARHRPGCGRSSEDDGARDTGGNRPNDDSQPTPIATAGGLGDPARGERHPHGGRLCGRRWPGGDPGGDPHANPDPDSDGRPGHPGPGDADPDPAGRANSGAERPRHRRHADHREPRQRHQPQGLRRHRRPVRHGRERHLWPPWRWRDRGHRHAQGREHRRPDPPPDLDRHPRQQRPGPLHRQGRDPLRPGPARARRRLDPVRPDPHPQVLIGGVGEDDRRRPPERHRYDRVSPDRQSLGILPGSIQYTARPAKTAMLMNGLMNARSVPPR